MTFSGLRVSGENSVRPDGPPEHFKPDTFLETNVNIKPSTSVPVAPLLLWSSGAPLSFCLETLLLGKLNHCRVG